MKPDQGPMSQRWPNVGFMGSGPLGKMTYGITTCGETLFLWAADPKGTMSYRTEGGNFRLSEQTNERANERMNERPSCPARLQSPPKPPAPSRPVFVKSRGPLKKPVPGTGQEWIASMGRTSWWVWGGISFNNSMYYYLTKRKRKKEFSFSW